MATTTTTSESDFKFAEASSKSRLPLDESNKPIPRSLHWGYNRSLLLPARGWAKLKAHLTDIVLIAAFVSFNSSAWGRSLYDAWDDKYGNYNVVTWGTFIITTAVYWALSGAFALVDLTGRPRRFFRKYKVQPFVWVGPKQYAHIALIALRNLLFVATPAIFTLPLFITLPTRSDALPGPLATIGTIIFDGEFSCLSPSLFNLTHSNVLVRLPP